MKSGVDLEVAMRPLFFRNHSMLILLVISVLLAVPGPSLAQRGALTVAQNLEEMVGEAGTIVEGYVRSWRAEPHPEFKNLSTLVIDLTVTDTLKGETSRSLTFRQYIWDIRDVSDGAGYRKGQHLLLMMVPESQYGLTSPVGMHQGRFQITRDAEGREYAVNGNGNSTLFRNLSSKAMKILGEQPQFTQRLETGETGPIELRVLGDMIRALQGVRQ